jgi:hypothetical protein
MINVGILSMDVRSVAQIRILQELDKFHNYHAHLFN